MLLFREEETAHLHRFQEHPQKKAMAIYGRRRTGKTELVLNFIAGAGRDLSVYYQCTSLDYQMCLSDFLQTLRSSCPGEVIPDFSSFRETFQYLSRIKFRRPMIIIDEFPFLAKKNDNAATEFQWIIDHALDGLKLILLGSSLSFMKNQLSNREAPLYGRFDEIIEIKPFSFRNIRVLFPNFEDAVTVYAATGGVAQYVMFFREFASVEAAMDALFFDKNGRLFQEAGNMLLQELREPAIYTAILRAIGSGQKRSGQIAKLCGMDQRAVYPYLNRLIDLGFLGTMENLLSKKQTEKRYVITDMLFRFTYTFIEPHVSMITALGTEAKPYVLGNRFDEYLGFVYEDIIRSTCWHYALAGKIPFMPQSVGKWWGNVQIDGVWQESEIDLAAIGEKDILLGECKYRTKAIGLKELELLRCKAQSIPAGGRRVRYLLAGRSGFTDELLRAAGEDVILIDQA